MQFFLLFLVFFSSLSFGSESNEPIRPLFENISFDDDFVVAINQSKFMHFDKSPYDPKVVGEHTFLSIFITLFKKVQYFSKFPLPDEDREKFDSMIVRNYYPLIDKLNLVDIERLIRCLIECNNTYFRLFVQSVIVKKARYEFFIELINEIIVTVETINENDNVLLSFQSISLMFTEKGLDFLQKRPLISQKE
jgi:hypothetical protein